MPSSHLILCHPLLLLPPIPPSIRVFSNESALRMRWPKYWSFSFSIIPSKEIPGLISFRMFYPIFSPKLWTPVSSPYFSFFGSYSKNILLKAFNHLRVSFYNHLIAENFLIQKFQCDNGASRREESPTDLQETLPRSFPTAHTVCHIVVVICDTHASNTETWQEILHSNKN